MQLVTEKYLPNRILDRFKEIVDPLSVSNDRKAWLTIGQQHVKSTFYLPNHYGDTNAFIIGEMRSKFGTWDIIVVQGVAYVFKVKK